MSPDDLWRRIRNFDHQLVFSWRDIQRLDELELVLRDSRARDYPFKTFWRSIRDGSWE